MLVLLWCIHTRAQSPLRCWAVVAPLDYGDEAFEPLRCTVGLSGSEGLDMGWSPRRMVWSCGVVCVEQGVLKLLDYGESVVDLLVRDDVGKLPQGQHRVPQLLPFVSIIKGCACVCM